MSGVFLGIDTSNYRTSLAAADSEGNVLSEVSLLLDVPQGKRGLRQSEAFFMHSNRLPPLLRKIFEETDPKDTEAIGVSERPRRVEGSYMPCFLAGVNLAEELSSALGIPAYRFSHQEGHAAAVMPLKDESSSVFMHLSGGTTEFLLCRPDEHGYEMTLIGGTKDISTGMLLDRIGTAMGLPFPSGSYLDDIAWERLESCGFDTGRFRKPGVMPKLKLKDGYFNLSGAETKLLRYIESEEDDFSDVITEVFISLAGLLTEAADSLSGQTGTDTVWMAGGVSSSRTVRKLISLNNTRADIRFGDREHSGDNAVGTARLAMRIHETGNSITGK